MKPIFLVLAACSSTSPGVKNGLIAFPADDAQRHQQLFTIEPDGTNLIELTFGDDSSLPSWSPDGTQLVYVARPPGAPSQLMIIDADGSHARALVPGDAPTWGPDGRVAFCAGGASGAPPEIFVVDAAGGTPVQLTHGGPHRGRIHPSWSGDGSRLVYMELAAQDPNADDTANGCPALDVQPELWTVAADGSDPQQITRSGEAWNTDETGAKLNTAYDANAPAWSSASDDVVFWSGQESCFGQVWRAKADGSQRTQLTHAPLQSRNDDPEWSPDGQFVLFSTDRSGKPELWMMNADGNDPHFIAANRPGPGPGDSAWQAVAAR